jgi:hypothetical protein
MRDETPMTDPAPFRLRRVRPLPATAAASLAVSVAVAAGVSALVAVTGCKNDGVTDGILFVRNERLRTEVCGGVCVPAVGAVSPKSDFVRYRISSGTGPLTEVPDTLQQSVVRVSDRVVEVAVSRVEYPADVKDRLPNPPPGDTSKLTPAALRCLQPTSWVESDSMEVRNAARKALGYVGKSDLVTVARKLENHVNHAIFKKTCDVEKPLQTAKWVIRFGEGDSAAHSVMLVGLARALGLPARAVGGVVFAEEVPGRSGRNLFCKHVWNEVWIAGQWYPLDAALLKRGGYGVDHIALVHSDLSSSSADVDLGPALDRLVAGLRIEVVEQHASR